LASSTGAYSPFTVRDRTRGRNESYRCSVVLETLPGYLVSRRECKELPGELLIQLNVEYLMSNVDTLMSLLDHSRVSFLHF
jgi:hypothetical protein